MVKAKSTACASNKNKTFNRKAFAATHRLLSHLRSSQFVWWEGFKKASQSAVIMYVLNECSGKRAGVKKAPKTCGHTQCMAT